MEPTAWRPVGRQGDVSEEEAIYKLPAAGSVIPELLCRRAIPLLSQSNSSNLQHDAHTALHHLLQRGRPVARDFSIPGGAEEESSPPLLRPLST